MRGLPTAAQFLFRLRMGKKMNLDYKINRFPYLESPLNKSLAGNYFLNQATTNNPTLKNTNHSRSKFCQTDTAVIAVKVGTV
jgi:hypothetical protein